MTQWADEELEGHEVEAEGVCDWPEDDEQDSFLAWPGTWLMLAGGVIALVLYAVLVFWHPRLPPHALMPPVPKEPPLPCGGVLMGSGVLVYDPDVRYDVVIGPGAGNAVFGYRAGYATTTGKGVNSSYGAPKDQKASHLQ